MSSSTFTPANVVDMSKEREWASSLGMLDWDSTRIVFTKRTLIEFLRYTGTTVDTNFTNISKLPKYATFGKLTENAAAEASAEVTEEATTSTDSQQDSADAPSADGFKPTRRVRTAPGGEPHDIFGTYTDDDALASAPPRNRASIDKAEVQQQKQPEQAKPAHGRTQSIWDDAEGQSGGFKPTRRVRERPGGRDSIADILSQGFETL